jgi:hypothetical protein
MPTLDIFVAEERGDSIESCVPATIWKSDEQQPMIGAGLEAFRAAGGLECRYMNQRSNRGTLPPVVRPCDRTRSVSA